MRHATRIFLSCLFSFFLAAQSIAAPVSDQHLAYIHQQGDVLQMQKLAESGDVRAQHWLGLMLHNRGRYDESIQWYSRAVENGDAKSANRIAYFYEHGIGRPKDERKALKWHLKGAELGDFSSQVRYATALRDDGVLDRDEAEAFKWFAKAAAQRDYEQRGYAYLPLAEMYEKGSGVRRDPVRAYAYAKAAEPTVDDSDGTSLTKARALRDRVAAKLSPAERASGDRLYRTLVPPTPESNEDRYGLLALALAVVTFLAWLRYWGWSKGRLRPTFAHGQMVEAEPAAMPKPELPQKRRKSRFPLAWCAIASLAGAVAVALILRAFFGQWALGIATIGFVFAFLTLALGGRALADRLASAGKDTIGRGAAFGALIGLLGSWAVSLLFAAPLLWSARLFAHPESLLVGLIGTPFGIVQGAVTGIVLIWLGRRKVHAEA